MFDDTLVNVAGPSLLCTFLLIMIIWMPCAAYHSRFFERLRATKKARKDEEKIEQELKCLRQQEKLQQEIDKQKEVMLQKACPINEKANCFEECVHFKDGEAWSFHDFSGCNPPSCRLWGGW